MPFQENKPYLFISYAHKDNDCVLPILNQLNQLNVNFWFDNGIEAGSEWPEYIAKKIRYCQKMICFISENYAASRNCTRELNFANDLNKDVLSIHIRNNIVLPDGMRMQLGSYQALFYENYGNVTNFCNALYAEPYLNGCRLSDSDKDPVPQPVPVPIQPVPIVQTTKSNKFFCAVCIVFLWFLAPLLIGIFPEILWELFYYQSSGLTFAFFVILITVIVSTILRLRRLKTVNGAAKITKVEKILYIVTSIAISLFLNCFLLAALGYNDIPGILCIIISVLFNALIDNIMFRIYNFFATKKKA